MQIDFKKCWLAFCSCACWDILLYRLPSQSVLTHMLCLNSGSASSEGVGLCGLRRRVLQRDLVISRCYMWRSSLWSISWLRHQMFYPYVRKRPTKVTIYATQCRLCLSFFLLFRAQRILRYVRSRTIVEVHPPKREKRRSLWIGIGPSNAPPKDADPELSHINRVSNPAGCSMALWFWVFGAVGTSLVSFSWNAPRVQSYEKWENKESWRGDTLDLPSREFVSCDLLCKVSTFMI